MESIDFHEGLPTGSPVDYRRLMLLLMWSIPICLIKVWPTTPEGFEPSIKVSLLDKLQSWALHRSAVDHAAKKEMEDLFTWHASMINDPGNIDVMGEYFDFLLEQDLQRLAVVDAALETHLHSRKLRQFVESPGCLISMATTISIASFSMKFGRIWTQKSESSFSNRMPASKPLERPWSPSMRLNRLYRSAYLAAWGPLQTTEEHLALLRKALSDEPVESQSQFPAQ